MLLSGVIEVKGQLLGGTVHMHGDGEFEHTESGCRRGLNETEGLDNSDMVWFVFACKRTPGSFYLKACILVIPILLEFCQHVD